MNRRPIKRMTSSQVVAKQEEYRERTISEVGELMKAGYTKEQISEEVGVELSEASRIQMIINRRLNGNDKIKETKSKGRGRPIKYQPSERRFF
ncbi:hypothetical protein [Peribacillus butanolivorans]|uniref:hypothetical protein n=1 Tax=Peribacillus butanolivorans TaxID=421767 RepID=UPI0036DB1533